MKKVTKKTVNYRPASLTAHRRCRTCSMFLPVQRRCTLVEGLIAPNDVCDRWDQK